MVEVSYLPTTCNHCDKPPCLAAARDGAVVKRDDGIVIIVPEKARGQRQIVDACPYGAVHWNEERQLPQAWPFDAHLLDKGWKRTRGAQSCPTQAMRVLHVEDEEMQRIVAEEGLEVLHPEYGTAPRVYYRNLKQFRSLFIGGTVAGEIAGVVECVDGARVTLECGGRVVASARSDAYGDFKFGGLDAAGGAYRLTIADERFAPVTDRRRIARTKRVPRRDRARATPALRPAGGGRFRTQRGSHPLIRGVVVAYLFNEGELPRLVSTVPGRERVFFVSKELTDVDDMLAGIMRYAKGASSPYHYHKNCEHFYFIMEGQGSVETPEGVTDVGPGDMVFIPAEEKHRLRSTTPLFYFEFQAPNRFQTTILDGTPADLLWEKVDGKIWVQS